MYDICYRDFTNDYRKIYFKLKVYLKSNLIDSSTKLYCNEINDIELHCENQTETLSSHEIVHINCKCNLEVNEGR